MPISDLAFQINQIQIGLENLNPNLPNYEQQRAQLLNKLNLLQMQRNGFSSDLQVNNSKETNYAGK